MIGVLLAEEGFGLDDLIRIAVVFGFLFLPALKKMLAGRAETGGEPDAEPSLAKERARAAAEQWKRLMRGELPEAPEAPLAPESRGPLEPADPQEWEPVAPSLDPVFVEQPKPVFESLRESAAPATFRPLREAVREPRLEAADARLSTLGEPRLPRFGGLGELSDLGELGAGMPSSQGSGSMGSLGRASTAPRRAPGSVSPTQAPRTRANWRRAVVLSEVLALPLALRKNGPWMGRP